MGKNSGIVQLMAGQYAWIRNEETANVTTRLGPARLILESFETCLRKSDCIVLSETEYVVICNPYNTETKEYELGKLLRVDGPCTRPYYYQESPGTVQEAEYLDNNTVAHYKALADFDDHKAGEEYLIRGPQLYFPSTDEELISTDEAIIVPDSQGIYIRDRRTGKVRLVCGPQHVILEPHEALYRRRFTSAESRALGIGKGTVATSDAPVLMIQVDETVCLINNMTGGLTHLRGPMTHVLGPEETVRTYSISTGCPKREGGAVIAKIRTGSDFMCDLFVVTTKDNAQLRLELTYSWCFAVGPKTYDRVFTVRDFTGIACQSVMSAIRAIASQKTFEELHNQFIPVITDRLFEDHELEQADGTIKTCRGVLFKENMFFIDNIDVQALEPVDEEIATLLEESISDNMALLCQKQDNRAEFEAEKERLTAQSEIEESRQQLVTMQQTNKHDAKVREAEMDARAALEKAGGEADWIATVAAAETAATRERIQDLSGALRGAGEGADRYLEMVRVASTRVGRAKVAPAAPTINLLRE